MIEVTIRVAATNLFDGYAYEQNTFITQMFISCLPDANFYGNKFKSYFRISVSRFRVILYKIIAHPKYSLTDTEHINAQELLDSFEDLPAGSDVFITAI